MGAIERSKFWLDAENGEEIYPVDSNRLALLVSNINLWVGERTMIKASPSLVTAHAELHHWASDKPGRLQVSWACHALLQAVLEAEARVTDVLSRLER